MGGIVLCTLSTLKLDADNINSIASALQSCAISIAESLFISSPIVALGRSWWTALRAEDPTNYTPAPKKEMMQPNEQYLVQATSTIAEQWAPEVTQQTTPSSPFTDTPRLNKTAREYGAFDVV